MLDYHDLIYMFHFLIIGPLLTYVGYYKEKVDKKILDAVMWFGLIVIIYHLYKFINTLILKNKYKTI
jgi:prepilin signal peptidase PulO-like enzyme (type II secretory pathway)